MKKFYIVLIISTLLILNTNCFNLRGLSDTQENKPQLPEQQDLPQEDNNNTPQQPSENNNQEEEQDQQSEGDVQNNDETENDEGEEEEQNNEEEEQQEINDEKQEENKNSNEEEDKDEVDQDALEKYNNFVEQTVIQLISDALELNGQRNELLKKIAFFSIEGFVENRESLTAEDIHEQGNILFHNQQLIEQLKDLNKHLEDAYHKIESIVM